MCGKLRHEFVDRRLGADVNALGRLIQDDDPWLRRQPLCDDHFLLVTAGKLTDILIERGRSQIKPPGIVARQFELLRETQKSVP